MILTVRKKGIATLSCMCAATEGNQGGEQLARAGDLAAAGVFCSLCSGRRQGGWSRNNCRDGGLADRLLQRRKQGEGHPRERKREARSSAALLMALGGDGEVSSGKAGPRGSGVRRRRGPRSADACVGRVEPGQGALGAWRRLPICRNRGRGVIFLPVEGVVIWGELLAAARGQQRNVHKFSLC